MLLGAVKILAEMKDEIPGEIRFFFKRGKTFTELKIIEAGGMDGVDACLGMHGMSEMETGYFNIEPGYRMAGCDTIYVKFEEYQDIVLSPILLRILSIRPVFLLLTYRLWLLKILTPKIR